MKHTLATGFHAHDSNGFELSDLLDQVRPDPSIRRSEILNGLTRRQRTFILEKLTGLNDKDAALVAGYSLSVAENTKQRVWKPKVHTEYERLQRQLFQSISARATSSNLAS